VPQNLLLMSIYTGPTLTFTAPIPFSSVGGSTTGLDVRFVICRNFTTGDSVRIFIPEGEDSWDCEAEGLEVFPGDIIFMLEAGIAE